MTTANENKCTEEINPTGEEVPNEEQFDETEAAAEVEQVVAELAPTELEASLAELRPVLLAIPADEVRTLLANPTYAVAICLRVAEAFERDRELFGKFFSSDMFDLGRYANLAERALALWQADILLHRAAGGEGAGAVVLEQAKALRFKMLGAAEYLYTDHPELGPVVAHIRSGYGKLNIADDLASLVNLFREQWEDAEPNCRITESDLDAATDLCQQVIRTSTTPTRSEEVEEALDLRNRAAEHLRRGVDDVRSAAAFVFRDDPEARASYPSLFSGRKRRNGHAPADEGGSAEVPAEPQAPLAELPASPEPVDIPPVEI